MALEWIAAKDPAQLNLKETPLETLIVGGLIGESWRDYDVKGTFPFELGLLTRLEKIALASIPYLAVCRAKVPGLSSSRISG
jgi:hypothetical protein